MLKKSAIAALLGFSVLGLAACDVDQTREADVNLPEYEVEQTEGASVTTPQVDVTPPDVNVTEEQKTVEVPTIETEEKTVDVPNIDIEPAPENEAAARPEASEG